MNALARFLLVLIPPLAAQVLLRSDWAHFSFYALLAAGALAPSLPRDWGRLVSVLVQGILGFVAVTLVLITPYSSYRVWLDLAADGRARGAVSLCFVALSGWLSLAAASGFGPGARLRPCLWWLVANCLLAFIPLRRPWMPAACLAVFLCIPLSGLVGRRAPANAHRGLAHVIAILGLSLTIVSLAPREEPRGVYIIDRYLSGALRRAVVRLLPRFPILYGVPGYGYGFSEERLGGRAVLSERPIFQVDGAPGAVYYLRGRVFDTFTGQGWLQDTGDTGSHGQDPPLKLSSRGALPEGKSSGFDTDSEVRLTLLIDHYHYPVHLLDTPEIFLNRGPEDLKARGGRSTGLTLERPLMRGEALVLARAEPAAGGPGIPGAGFLERYTAVPAGLDPRLRDLAGGLTPDGLAEFLAEGFVYNLEVPGGSPGSDFLAGFLFGDRQGYCAHFASAAVVLARLAGIPARYVTGFLAVMPPPDDARPESARTDRAVLGITGLNAHAWAEFWLPDRGWTVFEATAPMRSISGDAAGGRGAPRLAGGLSARQVEAVTGVPVSRRTSGGAGPRQGLRVPTAALIVTFGAAALAALAYLRGSGGRGVRVLAPGSRPLSAARRRWRRGAVRAVSLAGRLGIGIPERIGWSAWSRAVAGMLASGGSEAEEERALPPFGAVFFGARQPGPAEWTALYRLLCTLRRLRSERRRYRS